MELNSPLSSSAQTTPLIRASEMLPELYGGTTMLA